MLCFIGSPGLFLDNSSMGLVNDNKSPGVFQDNSSMGLFMDNSSPGLVMDDRSIGLFLDETSAINQPVRPVYGWLTSGISVITVLVNSWAIHVQRSKENELTSNLVICDFVCNIIVSFDIIFDNSYFWFPIKISTICAVQSSILVTLVIFNRLVPVVIVLLR